MDRLNDLKQFFEKLSEYQKLAKRWDASLVPSDELKENLRILRTELQRGYSRLENTITQYSGTGFNQEMFYTAFDTFTGYTVRERLLALNKLIPLVNKAIGKFEADEESAEVELSKKPEQVTKQLAKDVTNKPKAFIAHGGKSEALDKLCRFLTALGVIPIIAEEQSGENRSVGENVDHYARQCDCAIILATKGDIDSKTKRFIPRGNVLIEIGKSQELFKNRIIYLLQAGAQLPTDISEKVRARFTPQRMDDAFTAIARELTAFGILRAIKS